MPSPEYQAVVAALPVGWPDPEDSIEVVREKFAEVGGGPLEADVRVERTTLGGVAAAWVSTPESVEDRVLLHIHGGAFVSGSSEDFLSMAALLARLACARVAVFDYRVAPEHRFPAALDDCLAVYRGALETGLPAARIGLSGDSCGGGLAVSTLLRAREAGLPQPALCVGIGGWFDLTMQSEAARQPPGLDPFLDPEWIRCRGRDYVGPEGDLRDPLVSPVHADLRGLAPLFLQVGGLELTRDDAARLAERARAAGGEADCDLWPDMIHAFQILPGSIPEGLQARERMGAWIQQRIP